MKNEFLNVPGVERVTASRNYFPGGRSCDSTWQWEGKDPTFKPSITWLTVDSDFLETFDIRLLEGHPLRPEDDFSRTIHAMGTSLLGWVQEIFRRGLFAADARIFGLTSEGNEVVWKGYAAVGAAKVALESLARSIATEFAPYGLRCNVIQAGITETPALAAIPGSEHMRAHAQVRNPLGRLTTPRDVANVIALLSTDDAGWINGEVIRVDGGEHISGASQ